MKLRDLVANSLPRVKSRKKKATVAAGASESAAKLEARGDGSSLDKPANKRPVIAPRCASRDECLELQSIAGANWRGNALYRGLEAARAVKFNSQIMSTSYTSSHGMVTSHSAEGFSTQLMLMSRSYDSRMTVPDCNESCPQMSSISEARVEPFAYPQQYYHCHYHKHNHHHYHLHHHSKPMTPLAQNQQQQHPTPDPVIPPKTPPSSTAPEGAKAEPGFFRKSFASFGGFKKCSSKSRKETKQGEEDRAACSECPHTDANTVTPDRRPSDKRPAKPKRKSLKAFSKLKENKETVSSGQKFDKTCFSSVDDRCFSDREARCFSGVDDRCFSDREARCFSGGDDRYTTSPNLAREHLGSLSPAPIERSRLRERSVESCSSRLLGSRECSLGRDVDLAGFDSGSLSGYESDFPRSKVHRSRSRIKTNPWLPSPQPPLAGATRGQNGDLDESREDVDVTEELVPRVPRSASFDYQRKQVSRASAHSHNEGDMSFTQRPRSLTPSDITSAPILSPPAKSPSGEVNPTWWATCQDSRVALSSKLNDLNTSAPKSRPSSTVSPNSEFIQLADNLEQLASNISFDYEEMLDLTLESASVDHEDGQASIQELLTHEENGNVAKTFNCDGEAHSAHSPDSGIGGLGSTDGDYAPTPSEQRQQSAMSVEFSPSSATADHNLPEADPNLEVSTPDKEQNPLRVKLSIESACSSETCLHRLASQGDQTFGARSSFGGHHQFQEDTHSLGTDMAAALCESDVDNTSYHDTGSPSRWDTARRTFPEMCHTQCKENVDGSSQPNNCGHTTVVQSAAAHGTNVALRGNVFPDVSQPEPEQVGKMATLMVNERLDIQMAPCHRHLLGSGLMLGSGGAKNEHAMKGGVRQAVCGAPAVVCARNMRPSSLRTSPRAQQMAARMNDMEKGAGQGQPSRPWSSEFPRNITFTECAESPTDNWTCDELFAACCGHSLVTQDGQHASAGEHSSTAGDGIIKQSSVFTEQLVVQLHDIVTTRVPRLSKSDPSTIDSGKDDGDDKLENCCADTSFQMSDASVQTDFDDDFSKWDEADTLENLEERAIDPAESTRLWLLTGNMQGSADTGYSSLTRDSLIFMDEDSLQTAGELEERAAAERLSYGESSKHESERAPSGTVCPRVDRGGCQQKEVGGALAHGGQLAPPQDKFAPATADHEPLELSKNYFRTNEKISNCPRPPSDYTVLQTFSNSDAWSRTHQHLQGGGSSYNFLTTRSSSDSSDRTLRSSDSDDLELLAQNFTPVTVTKMKDSETGETKRPAQPSPCPYTELNSSGKHVVLRKDTSLQGPQGPSRFNRWPTEGPTDLMQPTRKSPTSLCGRNRCSSVDLGHSNMGSPSLGPGCERADYLEFLKDTPLNRSHLKRPLFLVPGLGPVDMSCSQQINLFAEAEQVRGHGQRLQAPAPPSMSPSTAHCGKKLKFKKGGHALLADHALMDTRAEHHSRYVATPPNHVQAWLHGLRGQPAHHMLNLDHVTPGASSVTSSDGPADGRAYLIQSGNLKRLSSSQNTPQGPSTSEQSSEVVAASPTRATEDAKRKDEITRSLRERVMSLRREKDVVFQQIQEARQEQRSHVQGDNHAQRKEALLGTLQELKGKLEEQSKLLKLREVQRRDV